MRRILLSMLLAAGLCAVLPAQGRSPELQKLDISTGHWVFHGTAPATARRPASTWTWDEDCRWSPNGVYLECTFSNVWAGRPAESLVVDTYNTRDKAYWHFEMFSAGSGGANPFAARMTIEGNTWTEYGRDAIPGKQRGERIIYVWDSPRKVEVRIETSTDGKTWTVVDQGTGIKQP